MTTGDGVLEMLADSELRLIDLAGGWREVARAVLAQLHERHVEIQRLQRRVETLQDRIRTDRRAA